MVDLPGPVILPDTPIPALWYDRAYFDGDSAGRYTSNYARLGPGGYSWNNVGHIFTAVAQWLCDLFPGTETFLDVGCAKGFLVRALRAEGREAWGIDHSAYAIAQADKAARPYLTCAPLETLMFTDDYDMVLAFEVLEHLRPCQIVQTLSRLHASARRGIFATIPTPDMLHKQAWREAQEEPSHVTLMPRAWWHEMFTRTGWSIPPFYALAERFAMGHPVAHAVGYNVFLRGD